MQPTTAVRRVLPTLALVVAVSGSAVSTHGSPPDPGAVVDRYFDAYRSMDLEAMLTSFAPDAEFIDVGQRHRYEGTDGMRQLLSGLLAIHTEMSVEIRRRVVAGNLVAVDYLYQGTLSGEALRAATGKETCRDTVYEIPVTSWFEIEDGRIRKQTDFIDLATLGEVRAEASGVTAP